MIDKLIETDIGNSMVSISPQDWSVFTPPGAGTEP
jgi:hypothetical protein